MARSGSCRAATAVLRRRRADDGPTADRRGSRRAHLGSRSAHAHTHGMRTRRGRALTALEKEKYKWAVTSADDDRFGFGVFWRGRQVPFWCRVSLSSVAWISAMARASRRFAQGRDVVPKLAASSAVVWACSRPTAYCVWRASKCNLPTFVAVVSSGHFHMAFSGSRVVMEDARKRYEGVSRDALRHRPTCLLTPALRPSPAGLSTMPRSFPMSSVVLGSRSQ